MNNSTRSLGLIAFALGAGLVLHGPRALAVEPVSPEAIALATIEDVLRAPLAKRGATATTQVAPPDVRRTLAACTRAVGFLPPGARLVGKTMVGVRCTEGASWQTFVGVDVRVSGPVWTTTRALRPGDVIGGADLVPTNAPLASADFDANPRGLASLDSRAPAPIGSTVQRATANGRPLVQADVKQAGRVDAGEAVRVVYRGDGFAVSAEGRAVGAADPGAVLLVRLASGSLVNGMLRDDRNVEIRQ